MPVRARWWEDDSAERYWLESTDRPDIGVDLRAPITDASGRDNWRYTLFREAKPGDIVFHYDATRDAITSVSQIAGREQLRPIVWKARGSYSRERGDEPKEVPGYLVPLAGHQALPTPITLEQLRNAGGEIRALYRGLVQRKGNPLYFPFELGGRPVRPLQGYAFKLPAAFVGAFSELANASHLLMPAPRVTPTYIDVTEREGELSGTAFRMAVAAIEAAGEDYEIGGLQLIRKQLRQLKQVRRRIFSTSSTKDEWAFHSGGRDELQFNLGLDEFPDGSPAFRTGVAFSFETSRSFPSIDPLVGKAAAFNHYMREHLDEFDDLAMWHWEGKLRSIDYAPGPIDHSLVRTGLFVFLGWRQPLHAVDPHASLAMFDRLLPLYRHIEAAYQVESPTAGSFSGLRLDGAKTVKTLRWTTASYVQRTLDIFLRHNELQARLKAKLESTGRGRAVIEAKIGQRAIDVVLKFRSELWFYEIKTADFARQCLREAIGQLLEYALWPGATRPTKLIVIGEPAPTDESKAYIEMLNRNFPIPLTYEQLALTE